MFLWLKIPFPVHERQLLRLIRTFPYVQETLHRWWWYVLENRRYSLASALITPNKTKEFNMSSVICRARYSHFLLRDWSRVVDCWFDCDKIDYSSCLYWNFRCRNFPVTTLLEPCALALRRTNNLQIQRRIAVLKIICDKVQSISLDRRSHFWNTQNLPLVLSY